MSRDRGLAREGGSGMGGRVVLAWTQRPSLAASPSDEAVTGQCASQGVASGRGPYSFTFLLDHIPQE